MVGLVVSQGGCVMLWRQQGRNAEPRLLGMRGGCGMLGGGHHVQHGDSVTPIWLLPTLTHLEAAQ